jgi:hypothetical protein
MENIIRKSGDNIGGIRDVLFVPMFNLSSIPLPTSTGIINAADISLDGLAGWFYFRFIAESGSFKEEQVNTGSGVYYKVTIDLAVAKDNLNRYRSFLAMEHHEFLVLCRDTNNITHLIGFEDKDGEFIGMRFKTKSQTREQWDSLNVIDCQFYLESTNKPRIASNIQAVVLNADPAAATIGDGESDPILPPVE